MSLSNPPQVALWLSVPDNCWMRGQFEIGDYEPDIHVILGSDGDDTHLMFEREALERFIELARHLLAVPVSPGSSLPRIFLESSHGQDIHERPKPVIV